MTAYQQRAARETGYNQIIERATDSAFQARMRELCRENQRRAGSSEVTEYIRNMGVRRHICR